MFAFKIYKFNLKILSKQNIVIQKLSQTWISTD